MYLPRNHPLIGINYFKIGKLQLYLEDYENAEINFKNSIEIIEITHGKESGLYQNLYCLLQQSILERKRNN
jgi:hypothetical protein